MTVVSPIQRNDYIGSGITGPYAFSFRVFAATDLRVVVTGANNNQIDLQYPADFSVTPGSINAASGSITLTSALAAGNRLTILRNLPLTQARSIRNQGAYYPATIEDALDALAMGDLQQQGQLDRALKVPLSVPVVRDITGFLPSNYLRVNEAGDGIEGVSAIVADQSFVQTGAGAVARSANGKMAEAYSVRDFKSTAGGGVVDDRAAFVSADTAAAGRRIDVTAGTYRIGSNLTMTNPTQPVPGAVFKPDNGATVTLPEAPRIGLWKWIDSVLGGVIRFARATTVYPEWWGAVPDGVTDCSAAINAAAAAAGIGGRVVFTAGNYYCASPVTQLTFQIWEGPGHYLGAGGTPPCQLRFSTLSGSQTGVIAGTNATFRNLLFRGPGATGNTCVGVSSSGGISPRFDRCQWYSWNVACALSSAFYTEFNNCEFAYNRYGLKATGCYNLKMFNPVFRGSSSVQMQTSVWVTDAIKNLHIIGGSTEEFDANGAFLIPGGSLVTIDGMYWEVQAPAAGSWGVVGSGSGTKLNLLNNNVYINNLGRWVGAGSLDKWSITSRGNKFFCSSTNTTPIAYVMPSNSTGGTIELEGDDWSSVTVAATYTAAANLGAPQGAQIVAPTGVSSYLTDHAFIGRGVVLYKRTAAPATPATGAIYLADGATWNPLNRSGTAPYYVMYDGASYLPMATADRVGTATWDPPSCAAGATISTTVTVSSVAFGDICKASFSLSLGGLVMFEPYVSGANTVTVTLYNPTGSAIDLGSGTLRVIATRY